MLRLLEWIGTGRLASLPNHIERTVHTHGSQAWAASHELERNSTRTRADIQEPAAEWALGSARGAMIAAYPDHLVHPGVVEGA